MAAIYLAQRTRLQYRLVISSTNNGTPSER